MKIEEKYGRNLEGKRVVGHKDGEQAFVCMSMRFAMRRHEQPGIPGGLSLSMDLRTWYASGRSCPDAAEMKSMKKPAFLLDLGIKTPVSDFSAVAFSFPSKILSESSAIFALSAFHHSRGTGGRTLPL